MTTPSSGAGRALKHSSIYAIGTLSRQLIGFLLLPVYTHYMSPSDYGVVGLLVFALALLEPLLGARLGEAVPKFYFEQTDDRGRSSVIINALIITGGISTVVMMLILLLREQGSAVLFGSSQYGLLVGLFSVQILTQALEYYGLTFIRIQQRPTLYIVVNFSKLLLQIALNIWFIVFLEMGALGMILGGTIASLLYAFGLTVYILRYNTFIFDGVLARTMLWFNLPLWFSGLAALYIFSSNRYFIRLFSSLDDVGYYELATRLAGVLPLLVWTPFSQFWEMERFRYYRTEGANYVFGTVFKFISTLLIIVALGLALFAQPVVRIMSSSEFSPAAAAVPFLALGMLFSSLSNFVSFGLLAAGKPKLINRNSYVTAVIITALNFGLIYYLNLGYIGAAAAMMVALGIQFFIIKATSMRFYDMKIKLAPFIGMLALAVAGFVATDFFAGHQNLWLDIGIRMVGYGICVLLLLTLLWRDTTVRTYIQKLPIPLLGKRAKPAV